MKKSTKTLGVLFALLLMVAVMPFGMTANAQTYNIEFTPNEPGKSYYYSTENNRLILYPGEIVEITISNPDVAKLNGYRFPADYFTDIEDRDNNKVTFTPIENRYTRMDYFYTMYKVNGSSNLAYCFVYYKACRNVPEGISLDKENLSVNIGETKAIKATALPDRSTGTYKDTDFKRVEWKSSDTNIATVDSGGNVTGVSKGTAVITATGYGKDSAKFAKTCTVTVTNNVSGISLDKTKLNLQTDETAALTATVTPPNADNGTVTWTSSNPGAATVAGGVVTPVSKGSTVITAEAGGHSAQCSIRVMEHHSAAESTCLVKGNIEYWEDADGKYYSSKESETPVEDVSTALKPHTLINTEAHDADCTENGNIEYWSCSVCGKYFSDADGAAEIEKSDTVIPALGHNMTETAAKAATCVEEGNTAYWTCVRCHKLFGDAEGKTEITLDQTVIEINPDAHKWDEGVITKEATLHEAGLMTYTCEHDSTHTKTEEIPKITTENGYSFVTEDHVYKLLSGLTVTLRVKRSSEDDKTFENFEELLIDGSVVPADSYDKVPGSVKLTLKSSYLDKLSKGTHSVRVNFVNGYAESTLKINSAESKSGSDNGSTPLTGGLLLIVQLWSALLLSLGFTLTYFNKGFLKPALARGAKFTNDMFVDAELDIVPDADIDADGGIELIYDDFDGELEDVEEENDSFDDDFDEDYDMD